MLNKSAAYEIIDKVLKNCNYYTLVTIMSTEKGLTRFANSEIHQNVYNYDTNVTIKMFHGKKESSVTTNILSDEGLLKAVKDAEENLKFVPDTEFELPQISSPEKIEYADCDEMLESKFSISERARLIADGISLLPSDYTAAGALSLDKMVIAMGNSKGIKRFGENDSVNFNVVIMHSSGSSGYAELNTNKAAELDVRALFEKAYNKAKLGINPVSIEPGSYTVILEPLAVGELLLYMNFIGFSAKSSQTGMGFLTGKLGEKVFGDNITIKDNVNDKNVYPFYFDFEGYERKPLNIIENGVAKELSYDIRTAVKDKVETTGHSVGYPSEGGLPMSLVMTGGKESFDEIIKSTKNGILITRFNYMNIVDPRHAVLTALTRDGSYLIEDGCIKSAIKDMRFTENMFDALNNVTGITAERTKVPGIFGVSYVPTLRIENFHLTGKTEL